MRRVPRVMCPAREQQIGHYAHMEGQGHRELPTPTVLAVVGVALAAVVVCSVAAVSSQLISPPAQSILAAPDRFATPDSATALQASGACENDG
jgi:hypothetical protein